MRWTFDLKNSQGIAGLDCWIAQSGLQSILVDWIVIDNPKSKTDFGFVLDCQSSFCISIQIQKQSYFLSRNQKLMVNLAPAINPSYFLSTFVLHLISWLIKICLLGIPCLKHLCKILLMFAAFHFSQVVGLWLDLDWIVNPF